MAWLQLTSENDSPILLDSEKILTIRPHIKGAHVTLTISVPNKEGTLALKTVTVREDATYIGRLMKATVSRR